MSSVFMCAVCAWPHSDEEDVLKLAEELAPRLVIEQGLGPVSLEDFIDEDFLIDTYGEEKWYECVVDAVKDILKSRECDTVFVDNKCYMVTGGMSYGDDPTDVFTSVCVLDSLDFFSNHNTVL
jgi:hypothetical protein